MKISLTRFMLACLLFNLLGMVPAKTTAQNKVHDCLKIPKELLREYRDSAGRKIVLRAVTVNNRIQLRFYGFNKFNELVIDKALSPGTQQCRLTNGNAFTGDITKDEEDEPLHHVIAAGPKSELTDWFLKPVKYRSDSPEDTKRKQDKYVSYLLSEDDDIFNLSTDALSTASFRVSRLNPSPPAR
jgi:hypothetical protein